jgi:hypothetical protein
MGKGDDFEVSRAAKAVKQAEDEISRKPEDVTDPSALEIGDQEVTQRHARTHPRLILRP